MGKIVALGGGDSGHRGSKYETEAVDREIIALTGKEHPHFLFVGLANIKRSQGYFEAMDKVYAGMYGCTADHLTLADIKSPEVAARKIASADIIYVGGGNTLRMMNLLRQNGTDSLLTAAYERGAVMCGVSAGGICWCAYGNSDSRKKKDNDAEPIRVRGLGLLPLLFCPHYSNQERRPPSLKKMMRTTYKTVGIGIDFAALEVVDGQYRIIPIDSRAVAKKCYWKGGEYIEEDIGFTDFCPLEELLSK